MNEELVLMLETNTNKSINLALDIINNKTTPEILSSLFAPRESDGMTALIMACKKKNETAALLIIKKGYSYRQIAVLTNKSVNTVMKVKKVGTKLNLV